MKIEMVMKSTSRPRLESRKPMTAPERKAHLQGFKNSGLGRGQGAKEAGGPSHCVPQLYIKAGRGDQSMP